jgi:hypothetical protein
LTALELARWQFGITTVFHFLFVPLTIGLSFLVAIFQTADDVQRLLPPPVPDHRRPHHAGRRLRVPGQ